MTSVRRWWAAAVAAAAVVGGLLGAPRAEAASTAHDRGYAGGNVALELSGAYVGFTKSALGGEPFGEIVNERVGPDRVVHKRLGRVRYEPITVKVGAGMAPAFYDWLKETFEHKNTRRNGAVVALDLNYREVQRTTFADALLTEVTFPALDATSHDVGLMSVTFAPQSTRSAPGSGQPQTATMQAERGGRHKLWTLSNFRLRVDGLDCSRVMRIEAFGMRQKAIESATGETRDYERDPANLEYSNLVVVMPEAAARSFYDWREDFLVRGNNGDAKERNGTIEILTADGKPLFTVGLKHLGISRIAVEASGPNETSRRARVEMYVEEMGFGYDRTAM